MRRDRGAAAKSRSWDGKRALDFGCGSARVLRHFADEAGSAAFWGCDIDRASIEWDRAHLTPPFRFFQTDSRRRCRCQQARWI